MASRGGRKRKRDHFEDSIDRIHETLKAPNLGDRSEYTRNLSIYLKAMDDLQPLLLDFGMLMAGNIIEDIAMHLKGPCMRMHRVCSETLVRISSGPDAEESKDHIRGTGVLKDLMKILELCQRQRSSSSALNETVCAVMNAIAHLVNYRGGIRMDDGIHLFHKFFEKSDFNLKTSALNVLKILSNENKENALEISLVAPKIMLSLANMLVCQDEKIHRSVLQLIFNLADFAPALVKQMDFPTNTVIKPILKIIRNESENLPKTVALGLGILSRIVILKGEYKVALAQLGLIPMLMETVQSDDRKIKLYTILLLSELGKDVHNQVAMVDAGGLPKIFDLFNIQHQGAQRAIRGVLFNFARNKAVISQFITGGWFEKILDLKGGTFGFYDDDTGITADIIKNLKEFHHHVYLCLHTSIVI